MATGRERRAERLNERLRGAQRANVDDESFSLDLGGLDLPAPTSPAATHDSPSSSAKRRKLDSDATSAVLHKSGSSSRRRLARSEPDDPYDLPHTSKESDVQIATDSVLEIHEETLKDGLANQPTLNLSAQTSATSQQVGRNPAGLEELPAPPGLKSPARPRMSVATVEEVGESPADAPGSGKRRRVPVGEAVSSSVRLLDVLTSDVVFPSSSSPSVRRIRRSDTAAAVRSTLRSALATSRGTLGLAVDELSPDRPNSQIVANVELSEPSTHGSFQAFEPDIEPEASKQDEVQEQEEQPEEEEQEEAEEMGITEAAEAIGKRRAGPQRGISPELGSDRVEEAEEEERPAPKRKRGRPSNSPATQRQPAVRQKPNKAQKKARPQAQGGDRDDNASRPTQAKAARRRSGQSDGDDAAIEITVQRFVNHKRRGDDDDADPLHTEIPFANGSGESAVDVFAQVCEEVISSALAQFRDMASTAADAAKKKECRIKMRAVEAYGEELNARFLQHTIHLNHWHSLRKRVRHVQREKLALREEIIRIRGEREQVALRMDAIRAKHEADTKESKYCLDASTFMHNVDLAIEQGQDAPELSRAAQKEADLANLELLVSHISDQVSSSGFTGGMLKQVKDFNAFLGRAAVALETR